MIVTKREYSYKYSTECCHEKEEGHLILLLVHTRGLIVLRWEWRAVVSMKLLCLLVVVVRGGRETLIGMERRLVERTSELK